MRLLAIHPSGLMYTRVFLTLEPLGLELVAGAARAAGHDVRIVDLQVESPRRLWRQIDEWRPDAVCLGGNYLANVPEIIDTAKAIKSRLPSCFVFVGGHSASFVAADLLAHAAGRDRLCRQGRRRNRGTAAVARGRAARRPDQRCPAS